MRKSVLFVAVVLIAIGGGMFWAGYHNASAPSVPKTVIKNPTAKPKAVPLKVFDKTQFSTTDPASPWVVVNKLHPLNPTEYAPADLTNVGGGQVMRAEAASALTTMLADAKNAGFTVTAASGYRSYATQVTVYNNEVKTFGQETADSESARPGYSEHQTGWAIDLASGGCSITDCFGDTVGGKWVTENAYKYGFLLRYTPADTAVTGYRAETWHFRYIGVDLATEMRTQNIATLEEFFGISGGAAYN